MRLALFILFLAGSFCLAQTPPFFNVKDFGATGDGLTIDTPAINAAISAASTAGGGTVTFPPGNYASVSIHLTNNVTLYLSNSAVILCGSTTDMDLPEANPWSSYQDYGHSHFHNALIWGESLKNIGLAGPGTINGDANIFGGDNPPSGQADKAVSLKSCTNVVISGVTITRAGHFAILANGCQNFTMTNATILNATLSNHRDAINLINSSHAYIANCQIEGSDDAMCLKADFALGQKFTNTDIVVENCTIRSTQNNATQFGSETVGDFSGVRFSNLNLIEAGKAGIGITSNDGGVIDGVTYDNITMTNCACPIHIKLSNQNRPSSDPHPVGRIRNVSINNVTARHSVSINNGIAARTNTATIAGYGESGQTPVPIENIVLRNVDISAIGGLLASNSYIVPAETQNWTPNSFGPNGVRPSYGWYVRHAKNISFINCRVRTDTPDGRPALIADDVNGIKLDGFTADVNATGTNASPYDLGYTNVTAFDIAGAAGTNGSALRIFSSVSTINANVAPPLFSPIGGGYPNAQSVTLLSATTNATIRFTTDGSTPTPAAGTIYTGAINVTNDTILKAVAYASGQTNSAVNTAIYNFNSATIISPPPQFVFEAEALAYVTNGAVAILQNDVNNSGGHWLAFEAGGAGQFIEYTIPNIPVGTYDIKMSWKGNTQRGISAFALDGTVLGATLDQYSLSQTYPTTDYGLVTLTNAGNHLVHLAVAGKNSSANGYWISTDQFIFIQLQAGLPQSPRIGGGSMAGANLVFSGTGGIPTAKFYVLASTNVALPLAAWTPVATNVFDAGGGFAVAAPVNATGPKQFYLLKCSILELP